MPDCVTDTHALIWYLEDSPRLGTNASQMFTACLPRGNPHLGANNLFGRNYLFARKKSDFFGAKRAIFS